MQGIFSSFPVIRRKIEDFPAVATLLGLILLSMIPYLQYRAWVLESISQAQEAYQNGERSYNQGDYSSATFYYALAYQLYQRPLIDSEQVLKGKLELAKGYHSLLALQINSGNSNLSFDIFPSAVRLYSDLLTSRNYLLDALAGLKAIEYYQITAFNSSDFYPLFERVDERVDDYDKLIRGPYSSTNPPSEEQKKAAAKFYYLLGGAYELQFDFLQAFQDYENAAELDSTVSLYQEARDRMRKLGQATDLIQACRTLLESNPQNRTYHMCLIQAYRNSGQSAELLQAYENMLTIFGEDRFLRIDAAAEYYKWGQAENINGNLKEALNAYGRAAELDPENESYQVAAQAQVVTLNVQILVRDSQGNFVENAIAFSQGDEIGHSDASGLIQADIPSLSVGQLQFYVFSEESGFYYNYISVTPPETSYLVQSTLTGDLGQALSLARSSAQVGNNQAAESLYTFLGERAPSMDDGSFNNSVCWHGSLDGFAELVMPACEKAVALAPQNGGYADSRGVARALTGDFHGAIEDFKSFIKWAQETNQHLNKVEQRKAWITALENGRNPFDSALLKALHNQ